MHSILVTGATGFVGRPLCRRLLADGQQVVGAMRSASQASHLTDGAKTVMLGEINRQFNAGRAFQGISIVIHLAARVHVMSDIAKNPLAEFREVNTYGTEQLAKLAAEAGVRRLVYVSSIKVNGEATSPGKAFTEDDAPNPLDPYGVSKSEAEDALAGIAQETGLEVVIVRPPLVYGPGVKGNFLTMLKTVQRGIPLPLGAIVNRRSLVYVQNLVDALVLCATHPAAAGETYLVSDGEDVSTPERLRKLGEALGVPVWLMPVPPSFLTLGGAVLGKAGAFERLLDSLIVESGKIRRELGWTPPFTLTEGLQKTAEWFKSNHA